MSAKLEQECPQNFEAGSFFNEDSEERQHETKKDEKHFHRRGAICSEAANLTEVLRIGFAIV